MKVIYNKILKIKKKQGNIKININWYKKKK